MVIPTYNQAALLRKALQSVLEQSFTDWEAVIINNYSEDDTEEVVKSFAEPRFNLVAFRNRGIIAASRNRGIELATGEWIAFLDSDDLWRPEKLSACLSWARMQPGADLISHREATFRGDQVLSISPHFRTEQANYRNLLFNGTCFSPSATLIRKSKLREIGGFSEDPQLTTCEDYDLWLRLAAAGAGVGFINKVLSDYRLHSSNNSGSVLRHMDAGLYAVDRHYLAIKQTQPLDGLRLKRRRAKIIYSAARNFHKAGRLSEARQHYFRSLREFPFGTKAVAGLLMVLVGFKSRDQNG